MSSWRVLLAGAVAAMTAAVLAGCYAGTWVVLPPVVAAVGVLAAAAVAVDYFGLRRRREAWVGMPADPRPAVLRARALAPRFYRMQHTGSPRAPAVARSYLLALAECDRLRDAGGVVDFLSADAGFSRVGDDPTADAVRAIALAEIGRLADARRLAGTLIASRRARRHAVVAYAWARVAVADGRAREAIERIDDALARRCSAAVRRDLIVLRARACLGRGQLDAAADSLRRLLADGRRRELEQLADAARADDPRLAMAASRALSADAPYR